MYKVTIRESNAIIFSAYAEEDNLKQVADDAVVCIPIAAVAFHFFNNVDPRNIKSMTVERLLWEMNEYLSTKIQSMPNRRQPVTIRNITSTMTVRVVNMKDNGGVKYEP